MPIVATAAVLQTQHGPYELLPVEIDDPRADEVRVRIEACGVCFTDLEAMEMLDAPCVLGHEGVGIVEAVGAEVDDIRPGQRVLVSYPWCGQCNSCVDNRPYHCTEHMALAFAGSRPDGSSPIRLAGQPIGSAFFQQSSFATHAIAPARDVVPVDSRLSPALLAALPCGMQTGAGAMLNSLAVRPGESVLVFGVGAVGLAAVMGARLAGAAVVIAVDMKSNRVEAALAVGATHVLDPRDGEVPARVRAITREGVHVAFDTSGRDVAIRQAMDMLATGGRLGLVTIPDWGQDYRLSLQPLFERAGTLTCIIQGSARPREFLPRLLESHAAGRFPIENLVTSYPFAAINQAIADIRSGTALKAVLVMP